MKKATLSSSSGSISSWRTPIGGLDRWILVPLIIFASSVQSVHAFVGTPSGKSHSARESCHHDCFSKSRSLNAQFQLFAAARDGSDQGALNSSRVGKKKALSHLENDANLCSWTENNPTWDQNIAALLEYNQTHGTVNLPQFSKEYPKLGSWVFNLRRQKGRLTNEQIQQLNDIGFIWKESLKEKQEKRWREMFMRLQAYKEVHGNCLVPNRYDPDQELATWVMRQRRDYSVKKIRKDREEKLASIGFVWRLKKFSKRDRPDLEDLWEDRYQELIEFKEEHNHTNVPWNYPPNKKLWIWVSHQREFNKDGTLPKDRKLRLDKIGFTWDFDEIYEDSWFQQYKELKRYQQELAKYKERIKNNPEGIKDVIRPVLDRNIRLWAANQRRIHANGVLDPQRKDMLDDIGFDWYE